MKFFVFLFLFTWLLCPTQGQTTLPETTQSYTQNLLQDPTLSRVTKPQRKIANFTVETVDTSLDGNTIQRTLWKGPVQFETNRLEDWIVISPQQGRGNFSLTLRRLENESIRLRLQWISKADFVQNPDQLWGYAKTLAESTPRGWTQEILTEYPANPHRKPANYLGRIPWVLEYQLTEVETNASWMRKEIFLEFPEAWLAIELETPEQFYDANKKSLDHLLRFGDLRTP